MPLQIGQIVENLIPGELVKITGIRPLGTRISLDFTGTNSNKNGNRTITAAEAEALEIVTTDGTFNFTGDPTKFALFAEAERIHSAYQFDPLFAVNCSIVDPLPHQVEAVYKFLLPLPKIRFLLADDTGAGKTIMAGLLIKELMMRGLAERILIVTPGGLTKQWQEDEMGIKFNLPFKLVNRSTFAAEPTVFHTSDQIVTSIDFISREDVLNVVSNSHWDLIIFDECHKLSAYDYGRKVYKGRRYLAAEVLAKQCEHILLLTATPHRGRIDTFKKLLQLLDEDIFATAEIASQRIKELERDGSNKFFIRRLKEDMKDWQGRPLFKNRFTQTVAYQLTPEEKELYDAVTHYLTRKKEEATESRNIHVALALTVMQRRLVSSIRAIKNTLERRYNALKTMLDEANNNPSLFDQRNKVEGFGVETLEEFEELEDDEREALETNFADPRKSKLLTTAKNVGETQAEAREVKKLYEMAKTLHDQNQEEKKLQVLRDLLKSEGVVDRDEKLVIFTEHKDTLLYLEERLSQNGGYTVVTIHGGKNVDERREAQWAFAKPGTHILIATDAAGEGINLQFCRLLINWDIPWNPNRLEQRMGRIHRYGQKKDVLVFNMVASNTKEGTVLERLLTKLDIIRQGLGDDRVYDVIQDVLEGISLEAIMNSVFNGQETDLDQFLSQDDEMIKNRFREKIKEQKNKLAHSTVDYRDARTLKENSDEKRLQPIYVRLFFQKAFTSLGGHFSEVRPAIFRIEALPQAVVAELKDTYKLQFAKTKSLQICFDKQVFLDYQGVGDLGEVQYMNPGNALFDSVVGAIRKLYREHMIKGTILVSPDDKEDYLAFFVKSQIADNQPSKKEDSIADERLVMVCQAKDGRFHVTSPAKFIDLRAPVEFAKPVEPPPPVDIDEVVQWSFANITEQQFAQTEAHVNKDLADRKSYLESAFTRVILDLQEAMQELQAKVLLGDTKVQEKIGKKQDRINELIAKKTTRLQNLVLMAQLNPKSPQILGCAYVVPLQQVEYQQTYGMSRDDEAEAIAMRVAMDHETSVGWRPTDVSANNEGYDIKSISPEELKRYIEVKGRSGDGSVMLSENEMNRLAQLGEAAWLYIVIHCKTNPELHRIQDPAKTLTFERKTKGVQYFLPMAEWKGKSSAFSKQ